MILQPYEWFEFKPVKKYPLIFKENRHYIHYTGSLHQLVDGNMIMKVRTPLVEGETVREFIEEKLMFPFLFNTLNNYLTKRYNDEEYQTEDNQ